MSAPAAEMQYIRFGNTGMRVSKIWLVCVKGGEESIEQIKETHHAGDTYDRDYGSLNNLVRSVKVRYTDASTMSTWQVYAIAESKFWAQFVAMQNMYSLVQREEQREMIPYCLDACISGNPWFPLAMGELLGENLGTDRTGSRFQLNNFVGTLEQDANAIIVDRVAEVLGNLGKRRAQVTFAWMYNKPYFTASISCL